jgi:RimJ/RimL family protein N-acetyltransferase
VSPTDYPKTIVLADGRHVVLRPSRPEDDAAIRRLCGAGPGSATVVVACDGERIVGVTSLVRQPGTDAELGLALDPEYGGVRLGTWMLLDGVHLAGDLGIERLVATVPEGDGAYRAALARLDFVAGGDGVMVKRLHRAWTDF